MKTIDDIITEHLPVRGHDSYYHEASVRSMMKEYAKQWVDRVSNVALLDEEMRTFDGVIVKADNHKEYKFNSAQFKYVLTVDKESILNVKNEIDAQ